MTSSPEETAPEPWPTAPEVLDAGTHRGIPEPRSPHRLPLDGRWHQVARQYTWVRCLSLLLLLAAVAGAGVVLGLLTSQPWIWIAGGAVAVVVLITIAVTPRQARSIGYRLRDDDLVFRRGIIWQRLVAVPYGRMQLVDITHGPLDRGFGIAQLKLVTAAATTGVTIPGLPQAAAEQLRDTLVAVAESRRTGL